jgi:hypothetical protein
MLTEFAVWAHGDIGMENRASKVVTSGRIKNGS